MKISHNLKYLVDFVKIEADEHSGSHNNISDGFHHCVP